MAVHHTEVRLHNIKKWNIRAYQLEETSQDLYLVASLTIPLTLPPCMALSQRRTVWCLRGENKDGVHSKKGFKLLKSNFSQSDHDVWWKTIAIKNQLCISSVERRTRSMFLLTLTALLVLHSFDYHSSLLLSPSFHFSALHISNSTIFLSSLPPSPL